MTSWVKRKYWDVAGRMGKWMRPTQKCITPGDWLDGIAQHVPAGRDRLVYVDGGAHDGAVAQRFRRRFDALEIHAFEPNVDLHAALLKNLDGANGYVYPQALGAQCGVQRMHINASPMTSSLLRPTAIGEKYFHDVMAPKETREVETITLDRWAEESGIERIDILKLDLQGYELEALRGAANLLASRIGVIALEVAFVPFYEGAPVFSEIDGFLRDCGYHLHNLYNVWTHLPEGHIGSCDAVFAPNESTVEQAMSDAA